MSGVHRALPDRARRDFCTRSMELDRNIDITAKQRKTVLALLERHLPNTTVWVYGSRANWTSRPQSDLDLVVFATQEQSVRVGELREAFEESNLPFRVDLFVWDAVPEQFRNRIEAEHVVLAMGDSRNFGRKSSEVAGEWPTVQLGEVVDLLTGFPFKSDRYVNDSEAPRLLRGDNIAQGSLRWSGAKRWSVEATDTVTQFWIREGDVVLAMDRPWIEAGLKFSPVRKIDLPALLVQRVARLRGSTRLDTRFLNYVIGCHDFTEYVISIQTGTAVPHISARQIKEFEFSLPPLSEQRAIAHILGTLDDKIELNRRMNQTLEAMARALFKSWFVDFDPVRAKMESRDTRLPQEIADLFPDRLVDSELGNVPHGWSVASIGEISEVIDCLHSKKPGRTAEGKPLLQLWNIRDDGLTDMSDTYFIDEADYERWTSRIEVRQGDCVITNVGRVGAVSQIPPRLNAALGRNMTAVRCTTGFKLPTFLIEVLLSDAMRWEIDLKTDSGTILSALNVRNIPNLRFVRAPKLMLETYERIARPMRARMEANLEASRTLSALRDTLLPKLISGELRVDVLGHSYLKQVPKHLIDRSKP